MPKYTIKGHDLTEKIRESPDYDERMAAAKARAEWELGDSQWAGVIIGAFLYPRQDAEALDVEKEQ